jgi:hypothetical protein
MKRQVDGFFQVVADVGWFKDRNGVLCNWLYDRDDVNFLHSELAHSEWAAFFVKHAIRALDLSRDEQGWRRVQPSPGYAGYGVCTAGPGGDHADAKVIGCLCVALSAYGARLLVGVADCFNCRILWFWTP